MNCSLINYLPSLCIFAIMLISGIAWTATWSYSIPCIAILLLISICLPYNEQFKHRLYSILPWALVAFFLGATRLNIQTNHFMELEEHLCHKNLSIRGTVIEQERTASSKFPYQITLIIDHAESDKPINEKSSGALIKIQCATLPPSCDTGDTIFIKNLYLYKPKPDSYRNFLHKQNIVACGKIANQSQITIEPQQNSSTYIWQIKKNQLINQFKTVLSPTTFNLFSSIFLGYKTTKSSITTQIREQFQWWGISHYLARSGLHLIIFVLILHTGLMLIPISLAYKKIITLFCIAIYSLFSWISVSFMRSLLMIFCYFGCSLLHIQHHTIHALSLACCLLLLYNPLYLFALDFQLSFSLTLALAILHDSTRLTRSLQH